MLIRLFGFFVTFISLFLLYSKKALFFEPLVNDPRLFNIFLYVGISIALFEAARCFWQIQKNKSFSLSADQFLIFGIALYFYLAFYASADLNYPQLNFFGLVSVGLALTILSAVSEAAFFYSLLLTSLYIFLTEYQLGYHVESSSFKKIIHVAFFALSWSIFLKKSVFERNSRFVFLVCLSFVIGIYYFFTALSKIKISPGFYEWALLDDLRNLLPAMCLYGWKNACGWNQWPSWILNNFWLGAVVVLIFEVVSLFVLSGRALTFLAGLRVAFHLIVFFIGGDIFAGLVFLNLFLVFLSYSLRKEKIRSILNFKAGLFCIIFFIMTIVFRFPIELGWYDTRVSQKYVISIVDRDEKVYPVDYSFWGHYMTNFVFADFSFLLAKTSHPVLTSGTSDTNQLSAFLFLQNLKDKNEFIEQRQNLPYMMKAEVWDNSKTLDFVKKYIFEKCVQKKIPVGKSQEQLILREYHHSMAAVSQGKFVSDCQNLDIIEFRIHMEESFFDGQNVEQTARVQVFEETF